MQKLQSLLYFQPVNHKILSFEKPHKYLSYSSVFHKDNLGEGAYEMRFERLISPSINFLYTKPMLSILHHAIKLIIV